MFIDNYKQKNCRLLSSKQAVIGILLIMINVKAIYILGLMILISNFLSGQNISQLADESYADLLSDVSIEASYGTITRPNNLAVYPQIVKKAQVFVLYFEHKIEGTYTVDLVNASGEHIENIYNSQLSIFNAKSSLSLEVHTPLESGQYYVVLSTKDFSQATKLMKF